MSPVRVYRAHPDAHEHVFEPLTDPLEESAGDAAAGRASRDREAERAAYERGLEEGRRQAEEAVAGLVQALAQAARRLDAERLEAMRALQHQALRLTLAVAKQVVMAELKINPHAVAQMVARLVAEAEGRRVTRILLHPEDAARLEATPVAATLREADIRVERSDDIAPGGCVVETAFGRLDARLETRLEEIGAALIPAETTGMSPGAEEREETPA